MSQNLTYPYSITSKKLVKNTFLIIRFYEERFKSKVTVFIKWVKKKTELRNNVYWIPRKIFYFFT